jgi:hypothetical protein
MSQPLDTERVLILPDTHMFSPALQRDIQRAMRDVANQVRETTDQMRRDFERSGQQSSESVRQPMRRAANDMEAAFRRNSDQIHRDIQRAMQQATLDVDRARGEMNRQALVQASVNLSNLERQLAEAEALLETTNENIRRGHPIPWNIDLSALQRQIIEGRAMIEAETRRIRSGSLLGGGGAGGAGGAAGGAANAGGQAGLRSMMGPAIGVAAVAATTLLPAVSGLLTVGIVGAIGAALQAANPVVHSHFAAFANDAVQTFRQASVPFAPVLAGFADQLKTSLNTVKPEINDLFKTAAPMVKELLSAIGPMMENLVHALSSGEKLAQPVVDVLTQHLPKLTGALDKMFQNMQMGAKGSAQFFGDLLTAIEFTLKTVGALAGAFGKAYEEIRKGASAVGSVIATSARGLEEFTNAIPGLGGGGLVDFMNKAAGSVDNLGQRINVLVHVHTEELAAELGVTTDRVNQLANILGVDLAGNVDEVKKKMQDYIDETSGAAASSLGLTKVTSDLNKQADEASKNLNALKGALQALGYIQESTDKATIDYYNSVDTLKQTLMENGKTLDSTTEKGRNNRSALLDLADQTRNLIAAEAQAGATGSQLNEITQNMYNNFVATAMQFGLTQQQAEAYAGSLGLIPSQVQTLIAQPGMDDAITRAGQLREQYNSIPRQIMTTIRAQLEAGGLTGQALRNAIERTPGGLATGGIVARPTFTRVGEGNRPEAVIPLETAHGNSVLAAAFATALRTIGVGGPSTPSATGTTLVQVAVGGEKLDARSYAVSQEVVSDSDVRLRRLLNSGPRTV